MNSPPDPDSPLSSTSAESPQPEDIIANDPVVPTNYGNQVSSSIAGSVSSKRRFPSGAFGSAGSVRDAKTRRRGESGRSGGGSTTWEGMKEGTSGGKKEKDELIDTAMVDFLRKEIGDPFLEPQPNIRG
ncbi:hypothetical protein BDN70DRAFT_879920 [Pholiota conissans]|uniref:Uncharacterized protein n=1 Tax=Pholiota conissans TaxID=109636 RepID=A0A9P5Z1N9_9AGAR|nr:hypothetical protein BDN70DRAFT_879920 [Pholiota conissans]